MLAAIGLVGQRMPQRGLPGLQRPSLPFLRHYLRFPLAVFDELPNGIGAAFEVPRPRSTAPPRVAEREPLSEPLSAS